MAFTHCVPVIASDVGSFIEYIVDGENGLIYSPNDWTNLFLKQSINFIQLPLGVEKKLNMKQGKNLIGRILQRII